MGRPLSKKYLGYRNPGADGNFGAANTAGDADLGGQSVTGLTVGTAGSYTGTAAQALTLTYPTPALSTEGAVTATGAPLFKYLSGSTLTGSATKAYTTGTGSVVAAIGSTTITFTPTLTSASGSLAISATTNNNGAITIASGTFVVGQDVVITGTGGQGISAGTYYVGAVASSTAITLSSSYANAIAGVFITTTTGSITGTNAVVGAAYNSIASLALVSGGTGITAANIASMIATPLALTQSTSSGTGQTLTSTGGSSLFGVQNGSVVNAGDGYLNLSLTPNITATSVTTISTYTASGLSANALNVLTMTPAQAAGTFYVGQAVTFTGTAGGAGAITGYSSGNTYIVTATDGASTITITQANGPVPGTTAGAITGLSLVLYTTTLSTVDEIVAGMIVTPASTVGGLTGSTAYYVIGTPNPNTNTISLSTSAGGNSVVQTTTTSQSVATTVTSNLIATFSSGSAAATATLTTAVTTGYPTAGSGRYSAIQATAYLANGSRAWELADIISQKAGRRFKVEAGSDGIGVCTLVTTTPLAAGQMWINATDSAGGTYYVAKLTGRKVTLVPGGANPGTQFTVAGSAGTTVAQWNLPTTTGFVTTAVANVSVVIDNG